MRLVHTLSDLPLYLTVFIAGAVTLFVTLTVTFTFVTRILLFIRQNVVLFDYFSRDEVFTFDRILLLLTKFLILKVAA